MGKVWISAEGEMGFSTIFMGSEEARGFLFFFFSFFYFEPNRK